MARIRQSRWTPYVLLVLAIGALWMATVMNRSERVDNTSLQREVLSVASQFRAPGELDSMTVANSTLETAQTMRYEIQQAIIDGQSVDHIRQMMVAKYGMGVLVDAGEYGIAQLLWWVPGIALVVAAAGSWAYVRRSGRKSAGITQRSYAGTSVIPDGAVEPVDSTIDPQLMAKKLAEYL